MAYKKVIIVGGGSSGWMTAAALSKLCPHLDITLIESKHIGTVGVGESTLGHINRFLTLLGLEDHMWMKACNATYKNSIRFTNFRTTDDTFFEYPFSSGYDLTDKYAGLQSWGELAAVYPEEFGPETFAEFYAGPNTLLAKYNRETNNKDKKLRNYNFATDTAYHMDAALFGEWLKNNVAIPNGVKVLEGTLHSHMKDYDGNISQVLTIDGQTIKGDLWIDCTGFKSLLLEEWMGQQFMPFSSHLANDSAWACRLPYIDREREMHNVTDCHALGNGWVWNIPLWNRIGTGYVYSSRFITKEDAQQEFRAHLAKKHSPEIAAAAEMFHINIKHGMRRRAWTKNVVGVGLSYGFVEPLESTGLLTTHENILKLVDVLNRRGGFVTRTEVDGFNLAVQNELISFRDFVAMHYALSGRTDTLYWKWCTQINEYHPDQFTQFLPRNDSWAAMMGALTKSNVFLENQQGGNYIMAGLGIRNISTPAMVDAYNKNDTEDSVMPVQFSRKAAMEDTKKKFLEYKAWLTEYIQTLPTHYQYLKDNIYGGVDEHM